MRAVSLSLQPPSWRKRVGTLTWKNGTTFIRNTVWRATKDTPRQITWKRCACTGRRSDANFTSSSLTAKEQDHRRSCPLPRETPSLQCFMEFSTPDWLAPNSARRPIRWQFMDLRLLFASELASQNGDNCLLTRGSGFIDLAFSGLLA